MSCVERVLVAACLTGCTLANRIDTCDAPKDHDVQLNDTTTGDQFTRYGRSLVRLPSGLYVGSWISAESPKDFGPSTLRAALFDSQGQRVPPCGSATNSALISVATDQFVSGHAVAVGAAPGSAVYFAWRSAHAGEPPDVAYGSIFVRLMTQDLCPLNRAVEEVFTVSDASDNGGSPAVAVRADGTQALVAWRSVPRAPELRRVRSRPVGVTVVPTGSVAVNTCDGTAAPCTHAEAIFLSEPALTPFRDGYALAWSQPRLGPLDGSDVRLQLRDRLGLLVTDTLGARRYGDVDTVDLTAIATADEVLLAQIGVAKPGATNPLDSEVYLERFGTDGKSRGLPLQVNSVTQGQQREPALAVTRSGAVFVSWRTAGESHELSGRVLDSNGAALFCGLSCDSADFPLSSGAGTEQGGVSLGADDAEVMALFTDAETAPGGDDKLGFSVHVRRFDVPRLVPSLR